MNIRTNAPVKSAPEHWVRLVGEDTDESIDGFELFSARRALGLLKGKLRRERLLGLLRDEISAGDAIVETLGEYVCSFFMREWDDSVVVERPSDTSAKPAGRRSQMLLGDGTVVGSIANAFDEEPDGFTLTLSVTLPATCGPEVIQQHLEHFAVEFRTWILLAAAAQVGPESAAS